MLPDKKIIAFDLDGTLTVSKSPITAYMADLVKKLLRQKMVFVISGGWFKQFELQFLPYFHNDEAIMPFIHNLTLLPCSGTQRYEYDQSKKEWQLRDREPLNSSAKEKAVKLLREVINSGSYEIPANPVGNIIEDRDTQITFSGCGQLAAIEVKRAWDPDKKKRQKIVAVLEPKLPEVSLLINAYSSIDIVPKGFNKAVGLNLLLNKMGLQQSDVVFVGDGLFLGGNDYSVKEAGIETIEVTGPEETSQLIKSWLG